ncbi:DUF4230 domain-containing protein [Novosphingobium colocasiae]|uniref:DUF4230 domain-containing protein n=1 Tax=Novosphingobium colocasiae TaxID=1256513 RepID=UPI0035AEDE07
MNAGVPLGIVLALTFAGGWYLAPRELLDNEAHRSGFLQTDRRRTLAATVESIRAMNRLAVYSYKGTVNVEVERTKWFVLSGRQQLVIPGVLIYWLDLTKLSYDFDGRLVTVHLPDLELADVAFQPEEAVTLNEGLLTFSQGQVEELLRQNYAQARRAFVKQAQQQGFTTAAKRQAQENVRAIITKTGFAVSFE